MRAPRRKVHESESPCNPRHRRASPPASLGNEGLLRLARRLAAHHAPEADVRHAGVRGTAQAGAGAVVEAVADAAEERATTVDALWRPLARVEALLRAGGVDDDPRPGPEG